jgi:DNA-binding NtrC family response regulator
MGRETWTGEGASWCEGAIQVADLAGQAANGIVGASRAVRILHDLIERVAATDATVLIRGESGVGKELVARAVHRNSARAGRPFVVVDCASLHENLLQSELFGHEQGSFTGAVRRKHGLFESADGGTLFLDEIGELTPALQVQLLRVLQTHAFRRLGGNTDLHVDVRIIAATNRSLERLKAEGRFREDLFYRLNVFPIDVPPLRERRDDIPLLVEHFLRRRSGARERGVSESAMAMLLAHDWPGNVRELEHVVERAWILCPQGPLAPEHLPTLVRPGEERASSAPEMPLPLAEVERRHIAHVLRYCHGHRDRAARLLRISSRTLYRRIREGVEEPTAREVGAA